MKTKLAFNARSQKEEEAVVTIDVNGEFVFTFADDSFFKLPGHLTGQEINECLAAHKVANEGQISADQVKTENEEKLARLDEA